MSDLIVLTIPQDIANRARQIAETLEQPVERVLMEHLKTLLPPPPVLPADVQEELDALHHLSDDALWTIAREQLPEAVQTQAQQLMERNTQGKLSPSECDVLDELTARADRLMLRKAEAAAILRERGYTFSQQNFLPHNG